VYQHFYFLFLFAGSGVLYGKLLYGHTVMMLSPRFPVDSHLTHLGALYEM